MKKRVLLIGLMVFLLTGCSFTEKVNDVINGDREPQNVQVDELSAEEIEAIRAEAGVTEESIASFAPVESSRYYYDSLSTEEQKLYAELYLILENHGTEITLSTLDKDMTDRVFNCVLYDNPAIFYVEGYSCTQLTLDGVLTRMEFSPTYIYDEKEVAEKRSAVETKANEIVSAVGAEATEYDKVKYVYETVVDMTEYVVGAKDNQNICSVLLSGESVCQGYAKTTQYLLNIMGIDATLVTGTIAASGENHAWTLAWIGGEPYYLDATWGDASYTLSAEDMAEQNVPEITYDYLNLTTAELEKTHVIDHIVTLPECNATEYNYYVQKGSFFTAVDENGLKQLFENAYAADESYVTIKCADLSVYQDMNAHLISEQMIFEYLQGDKVSYSYNEAALTYSFWL